MPQNTTPLNRALSKLGLLSRAEAARAILAGRVRVDGVVVRRPATAVVPERVRIEIDGEARERVAWRFLVFHKPRGVVTTRSDPGGRRTVFDVLAEAGEGVEGLVAVGRLDFATSGLLLLTTNTRLADWIADPTHAVPRVYLATVRGRVTPEEAASLAPAQVTVRKASNRESHLVVELTSGRNREVRNLCASIGHEVTRLKRVSVGGLALDDLSVGAVRALQTADVARAFPGAPVRRTAQAV